METGFLFVAVHSDYWVYFHRREEGVCGIRNVPLSEVSGHGVGVVCLCVGYSVGSAVLMGSRHIVTEAFSGDRRSRRTLSASVCCTRAVSSNKFDRLPCLAHVWERLGSIPKGPFASAPAIKSALPTN